MSINILCDVMLKLDGSIRPAVYLAEGLAKHDYKVTIISPLMSPESEMEIKDLGVMPQNMRVNLITKNMGHAFLWFEAWLREALLRMNSTSIGGCPLTINFSQMFSFPSLAWYLQGTLSAALEDIAREFPMHFKVAYRGLGPIISHLDKVMVEQTRGLSKFVVANSKYCASLYSRWGVKVNHVIYPPLDCSLFRPSTMNPSQEYVLTYFGKETEFTAIKTIADKGVAIKAFGSKGSLIPQELLKHPNIEFLGRVSTSKLIDLYSNALYTIFPFTHEPFGYIPLESMACGTPILTYNMQGPAEYVIDEVTGWLANSKPDLIIKALGLWRNSYASYIRRKCVEEAAKFDKKVYVERWFNLLEYFDMLRGSS